MMGPPAQGAAPGMGMRRYCAGVALQPGERVLYYRRIDHTADRVGFLIRAIILIPFIIGIVLLVQFFTGLKSQAAAQVVTNRRLFSVNGSGGVIFDVPWERVTGFTKVIFRRQENQFAIKDQAGQTWEFLEDARQLEAMLPALAAQPQLREQAPEVTFLPTV